MAFTTYPAVADGKCDYCGGPFAEGDYVAQPYGDEVMCPACILDHDLLEAA